MQCFNDLVIILKNLNGIPSLLLLGEVMYCRFFNVGNAVLHGTVKRVLRHGCFSFCRCNRSLGGIHNAIAF